jgi:plastocyanin
MAQRTTHRTTTCTTHRLITTCALGAALTLVGCKGEGKSVDTTAASSAAGAAGQGAAGAGAAASKPGAAGELTPDAGGKVITVQMVTDDKGNYFEPKEVEAHPGDVIRYTLKQGVHNVHFVADSNKAAQGLPTEPSDMLQLPGQTADVKVTWAPGKYYFQCDPHAALGMTGQVEVEKE